MKNITLPADVAVKYEIVDWSGGHKQHFGPRYGTIDLTKLSLAQADALVAKGFKKLQLKKTVTRNAAPEAPGKAKEEKQ